MTKAAGDATSIAVPTTAGSYKLFVVDSQGKKLGESAVSILRGLYGKSAKISVIHEDAISAEVSGKFRISKTLFPLKIEDYLEQD